MICIAIFLSTTCQKELLATCATGQLKKKLNFNKKIILLNSACQIALVATSLYCIYQSYFNDELSDYEKGKWRTLDILNSVVHLGCIVHADGLYKENAELTTQISDLDSTQ